MNYPAWLALVCVAAIGTGCSVVDTMNPLQHRITLYNNTDRNVLVGNRELAPRDTLGVEYSAGSRTPVFVFSGGCALSYVDIPSPPSGYSRWNITHSGLAAQLEPDGRIFAVQGSAAFPVAVKAEGQPTGFPLVPQRGSGCVEPAR